MIEVLLDEFAALADPGPFDYPHCHHHPGPAGGPHTLLGCITHGNEYGSVPAALELVRALRAGEIEVAGPVTVMLGNPEAARANRRFLEEDLNRVCTFDRPAESHERRRAEQLRPLLDAADYFLDIHQTQTPTEQAFYTFPWIDPLGAWAQALGAAAVGLTRPARAVFSPGTCCLDEYVRDRGRVGLTVEIGDCGLDVDQARVASRALHRFVELVRLTHDGRPIAELAAHCPPVGWYQASHIERDFPDGARLRPGLHNWMHVRGGERLSAEDSPTLSAPSDGYVLFPKYSPQGAPRPAELYRLATPISDPDSLR